MHVIQLYSDEELIYLYRQGNDWAFDELYQKYLPIIYKGVHTNKKELQNLEYDQAECLSKCCLSFYNCINYYSEHKDVSFGAYVYICMQYVIKTYSRRVYSPKYQNLSYDALGQGEAFMQINDFYGNPTKVMDYEFYKSILQEIASDTKGVEKAVLTCFLAGYDIKEMKKVLPYDAKMIANATYRIRKKIKKVARELENLDFERVDTRKGM